MSSLRQRVITSVFFVLVMLGGVFGGSIPFILLFFVIQVLCSLEFFKMVLPLETKKDTLRYRIAVAFSLAPTLFAIYYFQVHPEFTNLWYWHFAWVFYMAFLLFMMLELFLEGERPFINLAFILLGIVYMGIPFAFLQFIAFRTGEYAMTTIISLLVMNWLNDTTAYLVGSRLGKTKIMPRISPQKSWEGTLSGIGITLVVGLICYLIIGGYSFVQWMILAFLVSILGFLGDLIESMLKRTVGIKDSGGILPGHGGMLDRFDGFIFMLPFVAGYLYFIN